MIVNKKIFKISSIFLTIIMLISLAVFSVSIFANNSNDSVNYSNDIIEDKLILTYSPNEEMYYINESK